MDNKKLILILALLGGGYLIWRNSKAAAQSVGKAPADLPPVVPSDVPPSGSELPTTPKSQKDCPEGYVFVPTDCLVPPCEGGNCLPAAPEPMPVKGQPLVDIVELPVEATPVKDPFTEFLAPVEPPVRIKDPYAQIFTSDLGFGGFSFAGTDKNTLALQENLKQSVVKQSNFN